MANNPLRIAVLGAGSWGTALAIQLCRNNNKVWLWSHRQSHVDEMLSTGQNTRFLPGIDLPEMTITADIAAAVKAVDIVLLVVPSHVFRQTISLVSPHITDSHKIAWGTKGLEHGSGKLLHQQVQEELPNHTFAVVSGPTFAMEVAKGLPGAVTVASADSNYAYQLATAFHNGHFRAYTGDDVVGVEVGGATKNVMAIAAGIADGLGFGANTRAALITRALAEIMRLGLALGAKQETFMGLTCLGDLVLTCSDDQSRNRRLGLALGQGKSQQQALEEISQTVEGINTAYEVYHLAQKLDIEMPVTEQMFAVLHNHLDPKQAAQNLLERAIRSELD